MNSKSSNLSVRQSVPIDSLYQEKSMSQLYEESTKEKLLIEVFIILSKYMIHFFVFLNFVYSRV